MKNSFRVSFLMMLFLCACDNSSDPILEEDKIVPPQQEFSCDDVVPTLWEKGDGTPSNPFLLENASHLLYLAQEVNDTLSATPKDFEGQYFKMAQDIDLKGCPWTPIGGAKGQLDKEYLFNGYLDGNNKSILNLYVDRPDMELSGFFGKTGRRSTFKNLKFVDGKVIGKRMVGGIAGYMYNETMENCSFEGSVTGEDLVGGLVGFSSVLSNATLLKDCSFSGMITGIMNTGGIIGYSMETNLINCHSNGTVQGKESTGGLAGRCSGANMKITASQSHAEVIGDTDVGGIVGYMNSYTIIEDCYFDGDVSGNNSAGGIVGYAIGETLVQRCQNDGSVLANVSNGGGIVGHSYNGSIALSFNTGTISGNKYVGGIIGELETSNYIVASITSCYNSGIISGNSYGCGIAGRAAGLTNLEFCYSRGTIEQLTEGAIYYGITASIQVTGYEVKQCYYLEGSVYTQTEESRSSEHMKSEQFIEDLTDVTGYVPGGFKMDTDGTLNEGYPVLIWQ